MITVLVFDTSSPKRGKANAKSFAVAMHDTAVHIGGDSMTTCIAQDGTGTRCSFEDIKDNHFSLYLVHHNDFDQFSNAGFRVGQHQIQVFYTGAFSSPQSDGYWIHRSITADNALSEGEARKILDWIMSKDEGRIDIPPDILGGGPLETSLRILTSILQFYLQWSINPDNQQKAIEILGPIIDSPDNIEDAIRSGLKAVLTEVSIPARCRRWLEAKAPDERKIEEIISEAADASRKGFDGFHIWYEGLRNDLLPATVSQPQS